MLSDSLPLKPIRLLLEDPSDAEEEINPDCDTSLLRRHRDNDDEDDEDILRLEPHSFVKGLLAFMSRSPLLRKKRFGEGYASIDSPELASRDGIFNADQGNTNDLSNNADRKGKSIAASDSQRYDHAPNRTTPDPRNHKSNSKPASESLGRGIEILGLIKRGILEDLTMISDSKASSKTRVEYNNEEDNSKWSSDNPPDNSRFVPSS